ncbi:MAG: hypothetical protein OXU79_20920 [Gemmatimonadota bacterium]|nr:hypothetical protein [Gemmatimonadota bacterium]
MIVRAGTIRLNVWVVAAVLAAAALAMFNGIVNPSRATAETAVDPAIARCWRSAGPDCVSRLTLQAAKAFVARSDWELEIRSGAFAAGASALALAGNAAEARENFALAAATARKVNSGYTRARALRNVARVQAEAGDLDSARATARSIGDVQGRVDALVGVASASAGKGDLGAALESFRIAVTAARSNGTGDRRARSLSRVARAQAAVGYTASARATARSIDDIQVRIDALAGVASTLAQQGRSEDAMAFFDLAVADAGSIMDGYRRAIAIGKVAWARAEAGDEPGARRALDKALQAGGEGMDVYSAGATIVSLADVDPYVLIQIAGAQMKVEDLNGARKTLDRAYQSVIEDASPSAVKWLFNIASAQTAAGDAGGATRTIDTARKRLMSAGDDELAQKLVNRIAADQLETLLEIAVSTNPGDIEGKRNLVYHVAMRQAQTGETRRSMHHAGMIDRVSRRDAVLREIVTAQAKAGRFTEAAATAGAIKDSNKRIRALAEIALAQTQSGDLSGSRRTLGSTARELTGSGAAGITTWTWTDLAGAQVAARQTGEAKETLRAALLKLRSASNLARATWLPAILDVTLKIK